MSEQAAAAAAEAEAPAADQLTSLTIVESATGRLIVSTSGLADFLESRFAADDTSARVVRAATLEDCAAYVGLTIDDVCTPDGIDWGYTLGPADGAPVFVVPGWSADDGNASIHYDYAATGREAAKEYVDGGSWGDELDKTTWIRVSAWQVCRSIDEDGKVLEGRYADDSHTIALEPETPACVGELEHSWVADLGVVGGIAENPGVRGHGGGVISREHCEHCGLYCVTDTWAQDRETGEQGLTSVAYEEADDDSLRFARGRALDRAERRLAKRISVVRRRDDDCLIAQISDDGDDEHREALELERWIEASLGEAYEVEWSGDGDTDREGNTTSDLLIRWIGK